MPTLDVPTQLSLKNILFTTDFSDYAGRALPFAVGLARRYGSTLFLAHALEPEPRYAIGLEAIPPELDQPLPPQRRRPGSESPSKPQRFKDHMSV